MYGGPQLSRQTKSHGKTKKTRWSAVVICIWNGKSCNSNSNTLLARKPPFFEFAHRALWFELTMFCTASGSVVDEDANFRKSCGRGTFLNLKCISLWFGQLLSMLVLCGIHINNICLISLKECKGMLPGGSLVVLSTIVNVWSILAGQHSTRVVNFLV